MRSFAAGLRKDLDAVRAGLTERWSNGCVESFVHKLKLLKRSGLRTGGVRVAQSEDVGILKNRGSGDESELSIPRWPLRIPLYIKREIARGNEEAILQLLDTDE